MSVLGGTVEFGEMFRLKIPSFRKAFVLGQRSLNPDSLHSSLLIPLTINLLPSFTCIFIPYPQPNPLQQFSNQDLLAVDG